MILVPDSLITASDESLPQRIKKVFDSCDKETQEYLKAILREIVEAGSSTLYQDLWRADYIEQPVSIDTFLESDTYLGKTNRNGQAVYPAWRTALRDIFNSGNKYDEVVFSGATRIGKTTTAITGAAYMLYRLMSLKDPQRYFNKKEVSKFSILFFNITKDLAKGVAFREFNDTLKASPWFSAHGKFTNSDRNFVYVPDGDKIVIDFGSDGAHALGMQIFCVTGDTEILTDAGFRRIDALSGSTQMLAQYNIESRHIVYSSALIRRTGYTREVVSIELQDGTIIQGTRDHRMLMSDGQYMCMGDILPGQRLLLSAVGDDSRYTHVTDVTTNQYARRIPVYDVIDAKPNHNFLIRCSSGNAIVAHNCAIMDEAAFSKAGVKDINKAKAHMKNTYNTISARIKGTFRQNGEVYGKLFAVSSKNTDSDFLETYIQDQINSGAGEHMYVFDKPQWEVMPESMFHKEKFYVAVGNRLQRGFVVPDNQTDEASLADLKTQGFKLITPPIDMRPEFIADYDIALRDLAGISIPGTLSFISQESLTSCISTELRNPFFNDILQIGTKDNLCIEEFFHQDVLPPHAKRWPLYIHLDLSLNTDRTGISGVWISGRKDSETLSGDVLSQISFTHAFSVALEAPRGDKIPYEKIVLFLYWLMKQKFNIARISRDQFQSEYLGEQLESKGFTVDKISLDRTPDGYMALRSVLLEHRIDMLNCSILQDELIHLQRDAGTGRIDHPVGGCFTGDTVISLVDGRQLTIDDLIIEQQFKTNWVYTVNEQTLDIEPKRILSAHQTKVADGICKIILSNGQTIRCTPEHRIMLSDGSYIEASHLNRHSKLMCLGKAVCVVQVEYYNITCKVYDLTIEDNPNFALAAGVFVHNSKDVADSFAGSVWNAIQNNESIKIPMNRSMVRTIAAVNSVHSPSSDLNSLFGINNMKLR